MPRDKDLPLVVQRVMTQDERELFLARFTSLNPHWKGAHVADVLSALFDHEEHLEIIEQMAEDAKEEDPSFEQDELFDLVVLFAIYFAGPENVDWALTKALMARTKEAA